MNLIDLQLKKIKKEKRLGLMTHVVVGFPSMKETEILIEAMVESGADFIELQIPFSDPLADGPTIMKACEKSLALGTKVADAFKLATKLSERIQIPLLFMAYYNTLFRYGTEKFCLYAKKAGVSGLIIPDIPPEEEQDEHFIKYCKKTGLKNIRVISPASTIERMKINALAGNGFIYCTARQGITGSKKELDPSVAKFLQNVKDNFNIPIAVGFGISSYERIKIIKPYADIAIVGSAIIDIINHSKGDFKTQIKLFIKNLMRNS